MDKPFSQEIQDARKRIAEVGGEPKAFDIEVLTEPEVCSTLGPDVYTVKVLFKGCPTLYQGGSGLDWVTDFEYDLKWGVFGAMPGKKR